MPEINEHMVGQGSIQEKNKTKQRLYLMLINLDFAKCYLELG